MDYNGRAKMKRILFVICCLFLLIGCTNSDDAIRALDGAGYTQIEIGSYSWFACGSEDFYSTKFTATNPLGKRVSGVVCSGLLIKNATIRF